MNKTARRFLKLSMVNLSAMALSLIVGLGTPSGARADEAYATSRLKAMSDYMAAQKTVSFGFDATLGIVTTDNQKLALASSGTVRMKRPDKIHITRAMGFADFEVLFDGKTFTVLDKNANVYTQVDVPGTIDHLVDELRIKYNRSVQGADLLESNIYDVLMTGVENVKDLGSGVIGGVECDYFAFRAKEVDWEIWITQGKRPYPREYVITSKLITNAPQYSYRIRDWKTGDKASTDDFRFRVPKNAKKIDPKDLINSMDDLPKHFATGGAK